MATASSSYHAVEEPVDLDVEIPERREYEDAADAELDRKMVEAIDAARSAGNDHLVELLSLELGSHFYRNQ